MVEFLAGLIFGLFIGLIGILIGAYYTHRRTEYLKNQIYEKGVVEGQEKYRQELKNLRKKISAVKSIFKTRPQLNECFKKTTGWDFEKWLKER